MLGILDMFNKSYMSRRMGVRSINTIWTGKEPSREQAVCFKLISSGDIPLHRISLAWSVLIQFSIHITFYWPSKEKIGSASILLWKQSCLFKPLPQPKSTYSVSHSNSHSGGWLSYKIVQWQFISQWLLWRQQWVILVCTHNTCLKFINNITITSYFNSWHRIHLEPFLCNGIASIQIFFL